MTRKLIGVGVALVASLVTASAFAQPQPQPAVTVVLPAEQPPPAPPPPAQPPPAQPNVIVLQPVQPAQPAPPPAQPAPTVYVYELPPPPSYAYAAPPPPPPAPPKRAKRSGIHNHDSFYLRMGLGAGALALTNPGRDDSDTTLSTGGAAIEFGMGGTLGDGFVIGGRVIGVGGDNLTLDTPEEQTDVDGSMTYATLQLFADWYLDPQGGFHIEGALGPAAVTYDPTPDDDMDNEGVDSDDVELAGFGGSLGVGYEGWIGEQWSLGGLLRLNWATLEGTLDPMGTDAPVSAESSEDEGKGRVIAIAPMLMLTLTYH